MSPNEIKALDYVRETITRGGFSPRLEDIKKHVGVSSKSKAHEIVSRLVEDGYLRRRPNRRQGLELPGVDLRGADTEALKAELARRGEIGGALVARERPRAGGCSCSASWCHESVPYGHAFCLYHWRRISPETQRALLAANRAHLADPCDDALLLEYQEAFGRAKDEAEGAPWPSGERG